MVQLIRTCLLVSEVTSTLWSIYHRDLRKESPEFNKYIIPFFNFDKPFIHIPENIREHPQPYSGRLTVILMFKHAVDEIWT